MFIMKRIMKILIFYTRLLFILIIVYFKNNNKQADNAKLERKVYSALVRRRQHLRGRYIIIYTVYIMYIYNNNRGFTR